MLAISCAPVEQRAGILQARIEKRRREANAKAIQRLVGFGLVCSVVFGLLVASHHNGSDASPASVPAAAAAPAPITRAAFQDGRADRQAWEAWFAGTSGEFRRGAGWWSGQRSLPHPGACITLGAAAQAGCLAAKAKLDPTDTQRRAEPDYWAGWNSL